MIKWRMFGLYRQPTVPVTHNWGRKMLGEVKILSAWPAAGSGLDGVTTIMQIKNGTPTNISIFNVNLKANDIKGGGGCTNVVALLLIFRHLLPISCFSDPVPRTQRITPDLGHKPRW